MSDKQYELWHNPLQGKMVLPPKSDVVSDFAELNPFLAKNTLGSIVNAWAEGGFIDDSGNVWVNTNYLPQVVRRNRIHANKHALDAKDRDIIELGDTFYLRGSAIAYLLSEVIQTGATHKQREYAKISEQLFRKVRDSPEAEKRRAFFLEQLREARRNLKKLRIKEYGITRDELTGKALEPTTSEFSHIRSASFYLELADKVWNGLIVNQTTHGIITEAKTTDENELMVLCKARRWNKNWIIVFEKHLKEAA